MNFLEFCREVIKRAKNFSFTIDDLEALWAVFQGYATGGEITQLDEDQLAVAIEKGLHAVGVRK